MTRSGERGRRFPAVGGRFLLSVAEDAGKALFVLACVAQGRAPGSRRSDPGRASQNLWGKHLVSLIPQDTVSVKVIAQISP